MAIAGAVHRLRRVARPESSKGVRPGSFTTPCEDSGRATQRTVLGLGRAESVHGPNSGVLALEVFDFNPERGFPLVGPLDELPAIEDLTDDPGRRPERALHFGGRHADLDPL